MNLYPSPIHYQDSGKWFEINAKIRQADDGTFENTAGRFKARFGKKGKSQTLTSFEYKDCKVEYSLSETATADVAPKVETDTITYENILPSTDLRQVVTGIGIKEDIILKKYTGKNSFTFTMKTAGVDAQKEEDGSVSFYKKGTKEKVFSIPKPFMEDSNIDQRKGEGIRSDDVSIGIVQKGATTYITVTADEKWLASPERVYPVYIDPTTNLYGDDAYVSDLYPNSNFDAVWNSADGGYYQLKCGYYPDGITGYNESFVGISTSAISGKLITSAKFNAYVEWSYHTSTWPTDLWMDTVNGAWSATGITWNNRPGSSYHSKIKVTRDSWAVFDVTPQVGSWTSGKSTNYGFKLHENGNTAVDYWKKFRASENSSGKPYLYVTYSDPPSLSGSAYGNSANSTNGYVNLSWSSVSGAAGYKVWIYNGKAYEAFDVGNTTSWTSKGKKIWPTANEIAVGRYALHHDGLGTELADNPSPVYKNSGGSYPNNQNYWFRVTAYNSVSETSLGANYYTPTLPDRTAPPNPQNVGINGTNGANGSSSANVTVSWTGVNDLVTGSNSGTSYYKLELIKTNLKTNSTSGSSVNVNHAGAVAHSYTFTGQPDSTRYQAKVTTYDKNGNYSGTVTSSTWDSSDRTNPAANFVEPSTDTTISADVTVTAQGSDDVSLTKMNLSIRKYGTNDVQNVGERTGSGTSWSADWNIDTTRLEDGQYILGLTGYDAENNTSYTEITVNVENSPFGQFGLGSERGAIDNSFGTVNVVNGNFTVSQNDIKLPGLGFGTSLSRIYNSRLNINGFLGFGWRLDVPELSQFSDGSVVITDGDGAKYRYIKEEDGTYRRPLGSYDILTRNPDDTFTLKFKDGSKYLFDLINKKTTLTDKNNNSTTYQYDQDSRLVSITDASGRVTSLSYDQTSGKLASAVDYASRTWLYYYDANENLTKVGFKGNSGSQETTAQAFAYDEEHNLISITDANGNTANFAYSADMLSSVKDALGNTATYSYDPLGMKLTETNPRLYTTTYLYDINWNITSTTDALGYTSSFTYDKNYNLLTSTDGLGRVTTNTYDSMGNLLTETDPKGNTTSYEYDNNNNLIKKIDALSNETTSTYDASGNILSDGSNSYTYNPNGTAATSTDANGNTTTYTYDDYGNLKTLKDALGNETTFTYDNLSNKTSETDAMGNTTTYTYDSLGRMLSVTTPDDKTTTYTYDVNGNRLSATDAAGNVTRWEYDALGRVTKLTEPGDKIKTLSYDANGNMLSETIQTPDSTPTTTSFTYDKLDRQTRVDYPDGTFAENTYDAVDNQTSTTDESGTATYEYDENDNLTKETNQEGYSVSYSYDALDRLSGKEVQSPPSDGGVGSLAGGSSASTAKYNYDSKDNLTNLADTNDNSISLYTYDPNNNRTSANYANSSAIDFAYDALNRISSIANTDKNGQVFASFNYTYYANSLIKTVASEEGTTTYEYDAQNRLTRATDPTGKVTTYGFDSVGNRTSMTTTTGGSTSTTSYAYDSTTNELTQITNPDGTTVSYSYDAKGNTIARQISTESTTYEYNSNNQLTKVTKPNGDTVEFAYDAENRRVSKTVNGVTTKYVYDGDLIIKELDANGNTIATYIYDDYGTPVKVIKGGKSYFFHYSAQGDVVALTLASSDFYPVDGLYPGEVVASYKYDDWGNILESTSTVETPFGYRGKFGYVYDKETNLYFLKTRYYDPETGRFTTKDRFKGFENRPASQNQYTYCEGDPVNYVDPDGHSILSIIGAVLGILGIIATFAALISSSPFWGAAALAVGLGALIFNTLAWLNDEMRTKEYIIMQAFGIFGFKRGDILLKTVQHNIASGTGAWTVAGAVASKKKNINWSGYKRRMNYLKKKFGKLVKYVRKRI